MFKLLKSDIFPFIKIINNRLFSKFSKDFLLLLGSQISVVFSGLIGLKILTNILGPEKFGEVNLYMTISIFISMISYGPISNGFQRFCSIAINKNDGKAFFNTVNFVLIRATTIIIILISLIFIFLRIFQSSLSFYKIFVVLIFAISSGILASYNGMFNIMQKRFYFSLTQGILPWLRIFFAVILIHNYSSDRFILYFLGYCVADSILLVINLILFKNCILKYSNNTKVKIESDELEYLVEFKKYVTPFVIWGIFSWVQSSADRWAISYFDSIDSLGRYAVIWQLGFYPITLISGVLMQFFVPYLYNTFSKRCGSENNYYLVKTRYISIILINAFVFLSIFFISCIFHQNIIHIVSNRKYIVDSNLLPIVILSSSFIAMGQVIAIVFNLTLNTKKLLPFQIIMPLLLLLILFSLGFFFKLTGVVFGNLFFAIIYLTIMIIISRIEFKNIALQLK